MGWYLTGPIQKVGELRLCKNGRLVLLFLRRSYSELAFRDDSTLPDSRVPRKGFVYMSGRNLFHRLRGVHTRVQKVGLLMFLWALPSWISRGTFWYRIGLWLWGVLRSLCDSQAGRFAIAAIGLLLALVDWRSVFRREKKIYYDLDTLKGRTLQLRDEIKAFLDAAPPPPAPQAEGETKDAYLKRMFAADSRRFDCLVHGFSWRFHDRAMVINYQFGERGLMDEKLNDALFHPIKKEDFYEEILSGLTRLSQHSEKETGISNSAYSVMSFEQFREGKNRDAF